MKCNMCGKEVSRIDRYCNNCGENNENYVEPVVVRPRNQEIVRQSRGTYENDQKVSYDSQQQTQQPINIHLHQPQVEGSTVGWGFLSYFFPLVGIILYFIWKNL